MAVNLSLEIYFSFTNIFDNIKVDEQHTSNIIPNPIHINIRFFLIYKEIDS